MKRLLSLALALILVFALITIGAAAADENTFTAEETKNPLKSEQPSEIYEEAKEVNPTGKTVNILLVVDMQKDFVDQALGSKEAVAIVPAVVAKINEYKKAGDVIICTKDTHEESYLETQEGINLPFTHCVIDTEGWQFDDQIAAALPKDATVINKPTFGSTDLIELIGKYVAEYGQPNVNLEIIGLCTDICVLSNALLEKAFYPEMPISLDAACCAGVTPDKHFAALESMASCQIAITNWAEGNVHDSVCGADPLVSKQPSEIYAAAKEVNPKGDTKNVLLVVDMQKDFVDGALGTAEAVAIVDSVVAKIEKYKEAGYTIIATRDTHEKTYMDTAEGKNLPVVHCVKDSDGWLLNTKVADALEGYEDFQYIDKPTFGSTDLVKVMGEYVAQYGEPNVQLEIIGLCTDICVVSNALVEKAFYPEMPIYLDSTCCAGVTPESHDAAIVTMQFCQIQIDKDLPLG